MLASTKLGTQSKNWLFVSTMGCSILSGDATFAGVCGLKVVRVRPAVVCSSSSVSISTHADRKREMGQVHTDPYARMIPMPWYIGSE